MTAREKFIARLKEEGLYEAWLKSQDHVGKKYEDGTIIVFSHYDFDPEDGYFEYHYPSFSDMRENNREVFAENCEAFLDNDDDTFVANLARWLAWGDCVWGECPLFPGDAYWAGTNLETETKEFKDDLDISIGDGASIIEVSKDHVLVEYGGPKGLQFWCPVNVFSDEIKKLVGYETE